MKLTTGQEEEEEEVGVIDFEGQFYEQLLRQSCW